MPGSVIRRLFDRIDGNRDRALSRAEVGDFVGRAGVGFGHGAATSELMDTFDGNGSGDVSWREFKRGAGKLVPDALGIDARRARSDPGHIEDRTRRFYAERDHNRDGGLSAVELGRGGGIVESIKARLAVHALGGRDGKISRGEMLGFLKEVFR